jgi:hypothetical protein
MRECIRKLVVFSFLTVFILAACQAPTPTQAILPGNTQAVTSTESVTNTQPIPVTGDTPTIEMLSTEVPTNGAGGVGALAGDPKTVLLNAVKAMHQQKYRSTSMISTGDISTPITNTVEFVPPDNYHINMLGKIEAIATGGKTYTKTGDTWTVAPIDLGSIISDVTIQLASDTTGKLLQNATRVGPDMGAGVPAELFTFNENLSTTGSNAAGITKIWLRVSDGLPVRLESQTTVNGKTGSVVSTYDYDPTITITPPPT